MLESFRKQFATASIAKQRLLLPAVVPLTREQRARWTISGSYLTPSAWSARISAATQSP